MKNLTDNNTEQSESSSYILEEGVDISRHFNGIHSGSFSNIRQVERRRRGPFSIHSATRFGKRYILKSLNPGHASDPNFNMIQSKEFEIGISIDHPNIRSTFGIEDVPSIGRSIILEYIDGQTLDKAVASGMVNKDNARQIAAQLADAIRYLHSKQIVHGDIKPSNILVTHSGMNVKLIDFSLSDNEAYVILKNPGGTKQYTAPELTLPGATHSVKADIYSFGVVVAELAEAVSDRSLLALAKECCDPDPDKRPASIVPGDFLNAARTDSEIPAWNIGSRFMTRILLLAAAILAVTIAAIYYLRVQSAVESPRNERQPAETSIRVVDMERFNPNK